ncbi:hypothetical protein [Streptomyces nigra]|uniref:hypothetical protein n=1 Tax=Streptomyces nigra TaxID=1827580 RepID=UPI00365639E2
MAELSVSYEPAGEFEKGFLDVGNTLPADALTLEAVNCCVNEREDAAASSPG